MPTVDPVVQLHVHTDYSLLDGAASVGHVVAAAVADGAPALAVTDHRTMGAVRRLIDDCAANGLTAIPGLEADYVPDYATYRTQTTARESGKSRFHLVLLAVAEAGYRNLLKISSTAATKQVHGKATADDALVLGDTKGLVGTSSCLGSYYNQLLLRGEEGRAKQWLATYRDAFEPGRFFIEVQDHDIADQRKVTAFHLAHSRELGIPLLATNDLHYVEESDAQMHDALLAMQTKAKLSDPDRFRFSSRDNFYRTAAQTRAVFPEADFPGACDNTLVVAEMASEMDLVVPKGTYLIPDFDTPDGVGVEEHFEDLLARGLRARYPDYRAGDEVDRRARYEAGVIAKMGFLSYYLVVADVVNWAKANDIAVGPGRGSGAGSIAAYALGITAVDPLRYGLIFERFLNPGRNSMPDFDIDFEPSKRWRVLAYVRDKYGADRVSYIATYGEMKGKSALKSATRVLGSSVALGERLSAAFDVPPQGGALSLAEAMGAQGEVREKFTRMWEDVGGLRAMHAADPEAAAAVDLAVSVEGIKSQTGLHPAGVIIAPGPLTDHVPLRKVSASASEEELVVCEYDLHDVEHVGLVKMDFLGLINLSIVKRSEELVKNDLGIDVDRDDLPLDDKGVYASLSRGETKGVFQLEGPSITRLTSRLGPTTVEDISAISALHRPGPMGSDMHTDFAERKNGRQKISVPHPDFRTLFPDTFGLCVYQEQVMVLAQHFAGFTLAQADDLRRIMGKKDKDKMAEMEPVFKERVIGKGYDESTADTLWELLPPFSNYAFNKCVTAETVVYLGNGGGNTPTGETTVGALHARLHENLLPALARGSKDRYRGPCLHCADPARPARSRGRCKACLAWIDKFTHPARGLKVRSYKDGRVKLGRVLDVHHNGVRPVYRVTLDNGMSLDSTANHRHMAERGWVEVGDLVVGADALMVQGSYEPAAYAPKGVGAGWNSPDNPERVFKVAADGRVRPHTDGRDAGLAAVMTLLPDSCEFCGKDDDGTPHCLEAAHLDSDRSNNSRENVKRLCNSCHKRHDYANGTRVKRFSKGYPVSYSTVVSVEYVGERETYDLEMQDEGHNYVANGIVTHNSHSLSYAMISYQCAWFKVNYPAQFVAACIDYLPKDRVASQVESAREKGVDVYAPDVNRSQVRASTRERSVWLGLGGIRDLGPSTLEGLLAVRAAGGDFASLADLVLRTDKQKVNKNAIASLIAAGALDTLHPSRKAMSENLDAVISTVRAAGRSAAAVDEADDMFSLQVPTGVQVAEASFDMGGEDYGPTERLAAEVHALGFFAGAHPFAMAEHAVVSAARSGVVPAGAAPVDVDSAVEGQRALVWGAIGSVETKTSKTGKTITRISLETGRGAAMEVVSIGAPLTSAQAGKLAWVQGRYKRDEFSGDAMTMTASSVTVVTLERLLGSVGAERAVARAEPQAVAAPERAQAGPRRRVQGAGAPRSGERARGAGPASTPPRRVHRAQAPTVVFSVPDDSDALAALASQLNALSPGRARVLVRYRGEEIDVGGLWDVDAAAAADLATRVGVRASVREESVAS